MQKQEKLFFKGHRSTFWIKMPFGDRTPPHLHINCSLHVWGRAQGSQIFKRNSIISIRSKVMAFLVILLSPRGPRVVPVISTLSPSSPRHLHIVPIVPVIPRRSPCGLHGLWSPHVVSVVPVFPVVPTSSRRSPHHPQPPRYPLHLPPTPLGGGWGPRISKNAIRFELIKIF